MKVAVVGGSGYVGGELLRLLALHPEAEVTQVTSDSFAGKPVSRVHPNLRRAIELNFSRHDKLRPADVTFVATPHGRSMNPIVDWLASGGIWIDLSADFRLRDPTLYPTYYGVEHPHPELLARSTYGLPELYREDLRSAQLIAVPGCIATAAILALRPIAHAGILANSPVVIDAKSGSSASGADGGPASVHAERSGVMRLYSPALHRHTAEIEQETGTRVALSCHAVEAVRGVLATCHAFYGAAPSERDLWRIYRTAYGEEPFVRIVHHSEGLYRQPEPKILAGTNFCDVGFAVDPHGERIVAIAALDNLGKGAAGNAVQCWNIRAGFPEATGLEFLGLHPA
jgi:LysW-gamma-L-alpha-aminoadipyl-6-phosphate/LysW-L-glutamyl-5-phosphate reductase